MNKPDSFHWPPLNRKTGIVVIFCLAIAASASVRLLQIFAEIGISGQGKPVGKLLTKNNTVRRRPSNSFLWSRSFEGEDLYRLDSIRTDENSGATLTAFGKELELGESTLIVLDQLGDFSLNVVKGRGKGLVKGSVLVRSQTGDVRISVDKYGEKTVENLSVRLIKPSKNSQFFMTGTGKGSVGFSWEIPGRSQEEASPDLGLLISKNPEFPKDNTQQIPILNKTSTKKKLPPGKYFWKILHEDKTVSEPRKFSIVVAKAPNPIFPINDKRVKSWTDSNGLKFRWLDPQKELKLTKKIELSQSQNFSVVIASKVVNQGDSTVIPGLPNGRLFWRVKTKLRNKIIPGASASFIHSLRITPEIELTNPLPAEVLTERSKLLFSWQSTATEGNYKLTIEKKKPDKNAEKSFAASTNEHRLFVKNLKPGTYRWRVTLDTGKGSGFNSRWQDLHVTMTPPIQLLLPASDASSRFWTESDIKMDLKWKDPKPERESRYQVVIATDRELQKKVREQKTQNNSFSLSKLGYGSFYWQVSLIDRYNNIMRASEIRKFLVNEMPRLRAPASLLPIPGEKINLITLQDDPLLRWSAVDGASRYEISISRGRQVIWKKETSGTQVALRKPPSGEFSWSVKAIDQAGRKGEPMTPKTFSLYLGGVLPAPKLLRVKIK